MAINPQLEKNVKWARTAILGAFPYFAPMLMRIPYQILEKSKALAFVTKDGRMGLSTEICKDRNLLAGAIVHELFHVIFKHFDRIGHRNPQGWNYATDAVINETAKLMFANKSDFKMGTDWIYAKTLGLDFKGRIPTAEQVYQQLEQDSIKVQLPWACGSGAGNPNEAEDELTIPAGFPDELSTEVAVRQVASGLAAAGRQMGIGSAEFDMWASALVGKPKVDWKQHIRSFMSKDITASVARRTQASWRKLNRRGNDLPGRIVFQPKWAMGVDTSGSMSDQGSIVLGELGGVLMQFGPGRVVTGDTQVKNDKIVKTIKEFREACKGGGGTDMTPLIDALKDEPVVLIVTDAYVPVPRVPHDHVIWVTTTGVKQPWMKKVVVVPKSGRFEE